MFCVTLLVTWAAVVAGSVTQLRTVGYRPSEVQDNSHDQDPKYIIGEVIASEFDRHVPVLSDNLRGELNTLRNDISRQFDSLKHHMDLKLDRMQRDAPSEVEVDSVDTRPREEPPGAATPAATIRHNLAMAELRRLGAELTRAMNEEVAKLREEFRSSLHHLREQVQNSTNDLASKLGDEFSTQAEESTTMLKKVFFLTRSQMTLIRNQLSNITSAIMVDKMDLPTTLPPVSSSSDTTGTPQNLPLTSSPSTGSDAATRAYATTTTDTEPYTATTAATTEDITTPAATTSTITPTTTFTTTAATTTEPEDLPEDCMEALNWGMIISGVTKIRPSQDMEPKEVWCDQKTEGGGWTVMLWRKKQPIQIDFRRNWQSYAEGFGSADGEYWIGLETLYKLTKGNPYNLRAEMTWEDEEAVSVYDFFSVGPARGSSRGYELNVGGYNKSSTGGDAMEYHSGMDFSTYDQDNDGATGGSCSEWSGGGGWWFNYCYYSNPTGIYPPSNLPPNTHVDHLIEWRKWQGYYTYLSSFRMMIRPN